MQGKREEERLADSTEWSEEEQRCLELGLVQSAAVCDQQERWQEIAHIVGTRTARACAERYRACRAQACAERNRAGQAQEEEDSEEEDEAEGDKEEIEEEEEEEEELEAEGQTTEVLDGCDGQEKGGKSEKAQGVGNSNGRSARGNNMKGTWDTHGSWSGQSWHNDWHGRGNRGAGHKGRGGGDTDSNDWWQNNAWGSAQQEWKEGWDWRGKDTWVNEGGDATNEGDDATDDIANMDEAQKRALEIRREVEANRERMRKKEEQKKEEQARKEAKKVKEEQERAEEKQKYLEKRECERQEMFQQQEMKRKQQEEQQKLAARAAAPMNSAFAPPRRSGGPPAKVGSWGAKAAACKKGQLMRQRKQEELERQAADVLSNIASSKGHTAVPKDEEEEEEEEQEIGENYGASLPSGSSHSGTTVTEKLAAAAKSASAPLPKAANKPNTARNNQSSVNKEIRRPGKKKWWANLDGDCPISLAPLCELPQPPFGLEADGSSTIHYYDARFLASFLLSSAEFIDPINRRRLTREECVALDEHLQNHHANERIEASVADAFTLFQRHGINGDSPVHGVQREATAVLQHLFRFRSARRTDQRGRAIAYEDAGLRVVDDDDILAAGPVASTASAGPNLDRTVSHDYPRLDGHGDSSANTAVSTTWANRGRSGRKGGPPVSDEFPSLGGGNAGAPQARGAGWSAKAKAKTAATKSAPRGRGGRR